MSNEFQNFNLPKVTKANSPNMISSLNEIIHNENGKPITLNDNSIKRLKKLLNLDDFSSKKEKELSKKQSKTDRNAPKGCKKKGSLSTINETPFPAHRTDYTQIVSKVMILKKLSNNSKHSSMHSKSSNSLGSDYNESSDYNSDNNFIDSSRTANTSNIMKIVITDRVVLPELTPPRSTPSTDYTD